MVNLWGMRSAWNRSSKQRRSFHTPESTIFSNGTPAFAQEHLARRACFYAIRQSRRLQHDEGVRLHRIAELDARGERCPQPGDSVVKNLMVEKVQRRRACIQRVLQRCVVYHHRSALSRFAGSPCDSRSIARSTFPFLFSGMLGTFAMRVGLMKAGSNDAARPGSSFSQAVPS